MASDKKICPKCGKECDIGDLYCSCNYKFSFNGSDASSSAPEDKSGYTEQLKKRVDDYSTQYHQYDSDPPPSSYDDSNNYGEPAPDGSGCGVVILIIIVVVVLCAIFGVFSSDNSSSNNNSSYNNTNYNQSEETTTNEESYNYPSCDADTTLKPMKKDRTEALVSVFENSKYLLNAQYSLWYRNTQSEGEGYCKSEEMIKNLFWADPEVYIVLPISYRVYYDNDKTMIEHQNYSDMDEIINNGTFYKGSQKLSSSEVNSLLYRSLPENSNSNNSSNNYDNTPSSYQKPVSQPYRVPVPTQPKKTEPTTIYNYQPPKPVPSTPKPQPPKVKTDMEKSADSFFE